MLTEAESRALCEAALSRSQAGDASVEVRSETTSHARFADNSLTTSGRAEDVTIRVTAWVDRRRGTATTNDPSPDAVAGAVAEAEQIARISPVDREYVPTVGAATYPAGGGFAAPTVDLSLPDRAEVLRSVIDACRGRDVAGAGFHEAGGTAVAVATRNGNFRYRRSSHASLALTARTGDGTGSGYFGRDHFDVRRIDHARVAGQAVDKAVRSRGARPIEPGAYRVILEPQAAYDLLNFLDGALDARTADEGRSAFSAGNGRTRIGEPLFDERIMLYSDPSHPEVPGAPFTADGLAARRVEFIRGGALRHLVTSRFWAREHDREPTAGPVNYLFESAAAPASLADMIAATDKGLLITRFWYVRLVDPRTITLTGLTRDGVWLVENGAVRHPVGNLRFNQSILAMLAPGNLQRIGASERFSSWWVPALQIRSFAFTSISDAV
jgi:predicted Zn-dependent protease